MIITLKNIALALLLIPLYASGQQIYDEPSAYMNYLNRHEGTLSKKYLSYMSEVAHGHSARKMERRREDVVASIREAIRDCDAVRPYKGDASLRGAQKSYYSVLLSVFNEDYHKIVDMEEVAERSYDAMEAYLLMQDKARERLDDAFAKLDAAVVSFATRNNVKLTEPQQTKVDRKLVKVGKVNNYMNQVYLIFFKSTVQETLLLEALNRKDISAIEQGRSSMLTFAKEGLAKLDTLKAFQGDGSLVSACKKVLEFQKDESEVMMPRYVDFFMKEEEFLNGQKTFERKSTASRTKNDVESFRASVNKFNLMVLEYNKFNEDLNDKRANVLNQWESTRTRFLDQHMPKAN